ncbi:hypothetical protein BDW74DRAFT_157276 [Aspergillus multicolor]|uniref:uncharacterized protein n=1 Tax=Aspergillus multicolor TaxID=41759 RepID=UPI003CCDFE36
MKTEIGLAQQQLFDDDQQAQYAQYAQQPTIYHEPEEAQEFSNAVTEPKVIAGHHDLLNAPAAQDQYLRPEPHGVDASDEWSQTPSYNIFDTSSDDPSTLLNRTDFIQDSGATAQTEFIPNPELRRWTSMQGSTSSPHDTEPFSSVISPGATRTKSDITAFVSLHQPSASDDELSLPVATEMPKVEKRGRKKKQVIPASDEGDELALPRTYEPAPTKPEKRKPGRPPKSAKVDDTVSIGLTDVCEPADNPLAKNRETTVPDAPTILPDGIAVNVIPPESVVDEPSNNDQHEQFLVLAPEQSPQTPVTSPKEPKKKKLKRGKTTSVVLTKTYESGVEVDVIWVDQRPVPPPLEGNGHSSTTEPAEQAPAPKKRGRKRKKAPEQPEHEPDAQQAPEESKASTTNPKEMNTPQPKDTDNEPSISVVLPTKNTIRIQSPELANPIIDEDQALPDFDLQEQQQPPSPPKRSEHSPPAQQPPETPQKRTDPKTPSNKGPGKHSPISSTSKVPYRVGLSKRARIAPLLKIIKR